ncbi:hypothetical protein B0J18DRAFT_432069 [Chaetomium sp. MPI-SDFR-AT-0129]|nr:hypothetical protein B0J18DRAFT_432069 [Chaetomium sp. MPI-SDFR-AT-0129]
MSRVKGVTRLDFILRNGFPEDSVDNVRWRRNLMTGVAHFMAISWNNPQPITPEYRTNLHQTYLNDLHRLLTGLPTRFQPIVQRCIDSLDAIIALPMVLLHHDFGDCNVIVDETTCHLAGVVDWAEAAVGPFGVNLHSLQAFTGKLHLRNGWTRYGDYEELQEVFWEGFKGGVVRGVSDEEVRVIKMARVLGLLRSSGFTSRLANEPEPVPIRDDEQGRYSMLSLDGFLIDEKTRFD